MMAREKYEAPQVQCRERLHGHLVALTSGELVVSAAFRPKTYERPRIESRDPVEGALQPLPSGALP
jgi:hypothetical protein